MWHQIISVYHWFGELGERIKVVRDFNKAAKLSSINGVYEFGVTAGQPIDVTMVETTEAGLLSLMSGL